MNKNKKLSTKKIIFISILSLIGLLFFVATIGFWSVKPLLSKRIKAAVLESTDHLYRLDFEDINYDIISGKAYVLKVVWRADSSLYDSLKKAKKLPDNLYQGKVDHVKLTGLRPWTIFFSKKLELNTILIKDPIVALIHETDMRNNRHTGQ